MTINTFGNAQNVDIKTVSQALTSMNLMKIIENKMNKDNIDILTKGDEMCKIWITRSRKELQINY